MTEEELQHNIRKNRRLALAGGICAGVSLIIGGILLSTVGLVLSIISLNYYNKIRNSSNAIPGIVSNARKASTVGIVVCAIALVMNIVTIILIMPDIMEMLSTYESTSLNTMNSLNSANPPAGSKTWG